MSDDAEGSNIFEEGHNGYISHARFNRKSKVKGKWVRDNQNVGGVPIEEANEIATKLVGSEIDLKLPRWSDLCSNWSKCYWMTEEDVVTTKVVCLLCRVPVSDPMYKTHMKTVHPMEDDDTVKLIYHLHELRLARFYATSAVTGSELKDSFSSFDIPILSRFLEEIGFIIDEYDRSQEKCAQRKRSSGKAPTLPQFKPELDVLDKVDVLFGIPSGDAELMIDVMNCNYDTDCGLFFTRSAARFGIKCDYCYLCHVLVRRVNNRNHRRTAHHKAQKVENENLLQAIFQRLTDTRILKFSCANPIPLWKVKEICPNDDEVIVNKLTQFLKERGFIIDKLNVDREGASWPYVLENAGQLQFAECDDDNRSSTSYSSSISSTSSTATIYEKPPVNYFVMNGIRQHEKVIENVLHLEEVFDQTGTINQVQFAFLFGWASFNLVVSNGCKLSALCNMKDQDFESLQMINDKEPLALIKFETPKTGEGGFYSSWLILDRLTYDAFVLYRKVRDKIISDKGGRAHSFFFVSYFLKHLEARDVDHPINQFLRMCGVDWTFKAKHLVNAVNELIVRVAEKNSPEYALHFFKQLKLRCEKQKEVMESVEPHPFLVNMHVVIQKKVRKDKIIHEDESNQECPTLVKRPRLEEDMLPGYSQATSNVLDEAVYVNPNSAEFSYNELETVGVLTPERGFNAYAMTPPYLNTQEGPQNYEGNFCYDELTNFLDSETQNFSLYEVPEKEEKKVNMPENDCFVDEFQRDNFPEDFLVQSLPNPFEVSENNTFADDKVPETIFLTSCTEFQDEKDLDFMNL